MSYTTINIEGGLFPPDLLERLASEEGRVAGQAVEDFNLPPGSRLPDETGKAFDAARKYWVAFDARLENSRESETTLTRRDWMTGFMELLGFTNVEYQRASADVGGTLFPISHRIHDSENAPPLHIVGIREDLDRRGTASRRTPHALVQDYLNRSETLWGLVSNGAKLRLLRDSARLSRPTYLEFDLRSMLESNAYGDFVVLYRLLHASRFPGDGVEPHECLLEQYYTQGIEEGGRVRENLRHGVELALAELGSALVGHPRNDTLREAIRAGRLTEAGYFRQLLNFVYRMLFLMVTEERRLLSSGASLEAQAIYDRYYSVSSLRDRAEGNFADDNHGDLWERLAQTFRMFRDEQAATHLGMSPLNGELFGSSACKDIEKAFCPNKSLLLTLLHLSTFRDKGIRRRVNYAHLDVEEFGSVYESLLDYRPVVDLGDDLGEPAHFRLAAGTERKETGSYYTPPELVRELVESALAPVMEERLNEATTPEDKAAALLSLRVCDPASGSGHFLLAAARRIARELAKVRTGEDEPSPSDYRAALREVVRNCIYAVDKNPLAVDLCKVALWLESHAAGLPLSFLDHRIKCGDSLVGVSDFTVLEEGIPDGAYRTVTGDDNRAATDYRNRNRRELTGQQSMNLEILPSSSAKLGEDFAAFGQLEERSPSEVKAKEDLYKQLRGQGTRWWEIKTACDLWTYGFFAPLKPAGSDGVDMVPTTQNVRNALQDHSANAKLVGAAMGASERQRFFHWPLEFPDVMEAGGFDVVLGNPPWERIKLQEKEFFATRDPEIANAPNKAARSRLINRLPNTNPALAKAFDDAVHDSESVSRFVRNSNRFPLAGRGDVNTYSIFSETARIICHPSGRAGIIVPSGIATDDTTKVFFGDLVNRRSLVSLFDFENREKVFAGIDSRIKFCLLTMTGTGRPSPQAEFAFYLTQSQQLQDDARRYNLAPQDFALFNPNTRTSPTFRTRRDMEVAAKMYQRAGVFVRDSQGAGGGQESLERTVSVDVSHVKRIRSVSNSDRTGSSGLPARRKDSPSVSNPWGVRFQRMFDMSNDSSIFRSWREL